VTQRPKTGLAIEQAGIQTTDDRFPLAIYKPASLKNAEISLRSTQPEGKSDQGGGLAVRLSSPQNYYLVQTGCAEDRVTVLAREQRRVRGDRGHRRGYCFAQLAHADRSAKDDEFVVSLDGIWVFTGFDKTLSQAGRIRNFGPKANSVTRFDQIEIAPLP